MKIEDFEIFKFGENIYTPFKNNGQEYLLNKSPYLDIVLTDYCNANCNFCIADLIHDKLNGDFEKQKEKILFAVNHMNVKEVLLLGGEPTMSKNLIPMIEWLRTLKLDKIIMTTNGIRLAQDKEYRDKVLNAGLTHLNVSFMNIDDVKQCNVVNSKYILSINDLENIYSSAWNTGVEMRINNNIFKNNNDNLNDIIDFYDKIIYCCDSVKFSPLLETDSFSVIDTKTQWAKDNRLPDDEVYRLFNQIQNHFSNKYNMSIIENDLQFGFVKNTMIPLKKPIILNWNFGKFTGMMKKVTEEHKINNIKLLSNNELSLSWNRELPQYFIETK